MKVIPSGQGGTGTRALSKFHMYDKPRWNDIVSLSDLDSLSLYSIYVDRARVPTLTS